MWPFIALLVAIALLQCVDAVPAVITSTKVTTTTKCSCTSTTKTAGHTSTVTLSSSAACNAKAIKPTCKATGSTVKVLVTSTSSTQKTTSTSSAKTSSISSKPTTSTTSSKSVTSTSSPSASPTPVKNTGHRGLAYNDPNLTLPFSLSGQSSKVSWSYNWYSYPYTIGQTQTGYNPALSFVPMLWSAASDLTAVWTTNVQKAIASYGTTAVVAFNEPDGCGGGGSCMNLSSAIQGYQTWMNPLAGTVKLGAPGVTNGAGPSMGLGYLKDFLDQCTGCRIDFVPIHWYGDAGNLTGFEWYVGQAAQVAGGRPLWVTEFGTTSGTADQTMDFLKSAMQFLDGNALVEKYAWFMDAPGYLINSNGSGLSALGQVYNNG